MGRCARQREGGTKGGEWVDGVLPSLVLVHNIQRSPRVYTMLGLKPTREFGAQGGAYLDRMIFGNMSPEKRREIMKQRKLQFDTKLALDYLR